MTDIIFQDDLTPLANETVMVNGVICAFPAVFLLTGFSKTEKSKDMYISRDRLVCYS